MIDDTNPDFRATIAGYDPNAPAPVRIAAPIALRDKFAEDKWIAGRPRKYPEPRMGERFGVFEVVGLARGTCVWAPRSIVVTLRCECGAVESVTENNLQKRMKVPGGPRCRHGRDGR